MKHSVNSALTVPLKCASAQALLPVLSERFIGWSISNNSQFH